MDSLLLISISMVIPLSDGALGQSLFLSDCLNHFDFKSPVMISTDKDEALQNFGAVSVETTALFITYVAGQEEAEVAQHLVHLKGLNEIDAVLFLHDGHQTLLEILTTEVQLFNKEVTGIISESDFPTEKSALRPHEAWTEIALLLCSQDI